MRLNSLGFSLCCSLLTVAIAGGCADPDGGDPIDDNFLSDGKSDGAISEGTPEALGVLAVVNTLDRTRLDDDVGLDSRAATNIAKHRAAADGKLDTADDNRFDTLAELDAVPYVGKTAFARLLAYAQAHGFVPTSTGRQVSTCEASTYEGTAVCGDAAGTRELPAVSGMKLDATATFAANDVWAAGDGGTILHYDGQKWNVEDSPICEAIYAMWGTSSTNLWAVGADGRVLHRSASGWQIIDTGTCGSFTSVSGSSANDVWISGYVDNHGFVMHGGVQGFTQTDAMLGFDSFWSFAADDVWGVSGGALMHYDGSAWTTVYQAHVDFEHIWAPDRDHMFIAGFDWDKNTAAAWRFSAATAATPTEDTFSGNNTPGMHGSGPNDVWFAVGQQIWHFDGTKWTYIAKPGTQELWTVAAATPTDAWAMGSGGDMVHWDGTAWSSGNQLHALFDVWGTSATNAWASSSYGVLHYDGQAWTPAAGISGFFYGVWGSSASNVYAAGLFNKVKHFDGSSWSDVAMPQNAGSWWTITGTGANDVYLGGFQGAFAHFDGTTWTASKPTSSNINSLYAGAPNDLWAATSGGLLHFDGTTWATGGPLNTGEMFSVWGTSAHDIWATGRAIWHYDGNTWKQMVAPRSLIDFSSVWGSGPNDVWVNMGAELAFSATHLLHWDGSSWTTYVNAAGNRVRNGFSVGGATWAPEESGGILRLAPQ